MQELRSLNGALFLKEKHGSVRNGTVFVFFIVSFNLPLKNFPRHKRNYIAIAVRNPPRFFHERDRSRAGFEAVMSWTDFRNKRLRPLQVPVFLVKRKKRRVSNGRGERARLPLFFANPSLLILGMGSAVRAEKEMGIAAQNNPPERLPVTLTFRNRFAEMVGFLYLSSLKNIVKKKEEMVYGHRSTNRFGELRNKIHRFLGRHVFQHDLEPGESGMYRKQGGKKPFFPGPLAGQRDPASFSARNRPMGQRAIPMSCIVLNTGHNRLKSLTPSSAFVVTPMGYALPAITPSFQAFSTISGVVRSVIFTVMNG